MDFEASKLFTDPDPVTGAVSANLQLQFWKGQREIATNSLPTSRKLNESQFAIVATICEMARRQK